MARRGRAENRPTAGRGSFWDGFFLFAIVDAVFDLLGAIFEGLGSN